MSRTRRSCAGSLHRGCWAAVRRWLCVTVSVKAGPLNGVGRNRSERARLSRTFDLLITGQFEGAIRVGGRSVQPEELLLRAGKPVLMIPKNYNVRPFREEAVVAWDGSRYAARALTDAMHILETKRSIDVVTVNSGREGAVLGWAGSHDVISHLHRHGIDARHIELETRGRLGRAILEHCEAHDPDMLVMGAFGRGKLGAMLFGGVSQYILEHQSIPVLMSH